jgi:hypothetical protein
MSDFDNDPLVRRAIDELRQLPAVDASAVRRVVAAAAAARVAPADEPVPLALSRASADRFWSVVGVAAAAAIIGFVARGALTSRASEPTAHVQSPVASSGAPAVLVRDAASEREAMVVPQQFVFENRDAHRIAVVGDFNKWNPATDPMTRSPDGTTWSAIVPIFPGRHTFGYMVDDSVFTLDPRAPKVRDPDLGITGSAVIVGRP